MFLDGESEVKVVPSAQMAASVLFHCGLNALANCKFRPVKPLVPDFPEQSPLDGSANIGAAQTATDAHNFPVPKGGRGDGSAGAEGMRRLGGGSVRLSPLPSIVATGKISVKLLVGNDLKHFDASRGREVPDAGEEISPNLSND